METLIVNVDHGSGDWSSISLFRRAADGTLHVVETQEAMEIAIDRIGRRMQRMHREYKRPAGYSQAHWRKLWKQRATKAGE